jgi:hypothetical protein
LQESPERAPCADLAGQLAGPNVARVFFQLHGLDGVLFLETAPGRHPHQWVVQGFTHY